MGRRELAIIHVNPQMPHQVGWGESFRAGFSAVGFDVRIDHDPQCSGDLNLVQGPHWAMRQHLHHPRTLMVDRAWYGPIGWPGEMISLGWLRLDESRCYPHHDDGERWRGHCSKFGVRLEPVARGSITILFGDYSEDRSLYARIISDARALGHQIRYRPHPHAASWTDCPVPQAEGDLNALLDDCRLAIGFRSSVLVTAALAGVPVCCFDVRSIVYPVAMHELSGDDGMTNRQQWAYALACAQWSAEEISRGVFWPALAERWNEIDTSEHAVGAIAVAGAADAR